MARREQAQREWVTAFSSSLEAAGADMFSDLQPGRSRHRSRRAMARRPSHPVRTGSFQANGRLPGRRHPRDLVREHRHPIPQELFQGVLTREKRRAERFGHPFILVLVGSRSGSLCLPDWTSATEALSAAAGETAVLGWLEREAQLGAILPEPCGSDTVDTGQLEMLVRRELASRLAAEVADRLSIRARVYAPPDPTRTSGRETDQFPADSHTPEAGRTAGDAIKRGLDIVGSLTLLVLLAPVFLLIAALLKLTSPGPILFKQARVGRMARPFTMLKFRTMRVDADQALHQQFVTRFIKSSAQLHPAGRKMVFKLTNDPRVTPLGRILRKSSLDELPQFWNVLRGDMSLVGPRPPLAYEGEQYQPWHWRRVLHAKPGITGLWQVTGRSRTTFDEMVRLDLRYVRTRSLWTDIRILLATPRAVISGKGAQ